MKVTVERRYEIELDEETSEEIRNAAKDEEMTIAEFLEAEPQMMGDLDAGWVDDDIRVVSVVANHATGAREISRTKND